MRALQGGVRLTFLLFFSSHIIFTLICDLQALFKPYYPQILQDMVVWWCKTVYDPHMAEPFDLWFQSLVFFEMILQLPYFFFAVYMFSDAKRETYPRWFQMFSIVYGTHTATTLVPLLPTIVVQEEDTPIERMWCALIYLPYFVFPAWIAWIAATSPDTPPEKVIKKT